MTNIDALEQELPSLDITSSQQRRRRVDILNSLAWEYRVENSRRSYDYALEARKLLEEDPYPEGEARCISAIVVALDLESKYQEALELGIEGLSICARHKFDEISMRIRISLGNIYQSLGSPEASFEHYRIAYDNSVALEDTRAQQMTRNNMAILSSVSGDHEAAISAFRMNLENHMKAGNWNGAALAWNNLAMSYKELGDLDEAVSCGNQALRTVFENEAFIHKLDVLTTVGDLELLSNNIESAKAHFNQALAYAREKQRPNFEAISLFYLGQTSFNEGQYKNALALTEQSLKLHETLQTKEGLMNGYKLMSDIAEAMEDFPRALKYLKLHQDMKERYLSEASETRLQSLVILHKTEKATTEAEIERLKNVELRQAMDKIKKLTGLLPICAHCKDIRDDKGYWHDVAVYIRDNSEAELSHGICPNCAKKHYSIYPERA